VQGWVRVGEVSTRPQSIEVSGERLVKKAHPHTFRTWPLEDLASGKLGLSKMGKLAVFDENFERTLPPRLFPMNELAMDFPPGRVDNGYLKVLIVPQAVVAEMLCKLSAVRDGFKIAFEVDPDPIPKRDAIFHIEKELLHCRTSNRFSYGRSSKRRDYRKRLAESPRLGANDRD
jgi:hypothetical protein